VDAISFFAADAGPDQLYLTARTDGGGAAAAEDACARAASALDSRGMRILSERAFGTLDFHADYARIRGNHRAFGRGPFSYIEGAPVRGGGLSGIQIHAVGPASDEDYSILYDGRRPCGAVWRRHDAAWVHLAGIRGADGGSRGDQAASMFEAMERILASASADCRSVVRTWISLDGILDWYGTFNRVRTEKFRSCGLLPAPGEGPGPTPARLPASTAIGGRNPAGAACCLDALAVSGAVRASVLEGSSQPPASSYGSAFSRGIRFCEKGCRRVFVSGTAAIGPDGRSLHPGDAEAQMRTTLEVVGLLIAGQGGRLEDIVSATVYLKRAGDRSVFDTLAGRLGLTSLPAVFIVADICRDELLFEMDAVAVIR